MTQFRDDIFFNPSGGADSDSTARAVAKGDYRELRYCRLGNVSGQGATVVTSLGTIEINNPSIDELDRIMGATVWQKRYSIVYFVYKYGANDEVWRYDIASQTHELIFDSADLNFDPLFPFFHADVIDDILRVAGGKWDATLYDQTTGNILYNYPWGINLQKALDGDYTVIDSQVLNAIKFPPLPPVAGYGTDTDHFDNKLRRKLFRFRVQYIYENNEETVWSMWSNLALPTESEFISGNNWPQSLVDNKIDIVFDSGSDVVKKINVAVQAYDEGNSSVDAGFGIFSQIDKAQDGISDNTSVTLPFYGNASLKPISNLKGNYDRLPLYARCQSLVDNTKVAYTNFVEGYDKLPLLQVDVNPIYREIYWRPLSGAIDMDSTATSPHLVLDWVTDANFVIAEADVFAVSLTLTSGQVLLLSYTITQNDVDTALLEVTVADQMFYILGVVSDNYAVQATAITGVVFTSVADSPFAGLYTLQTGSPLEWDDNNFTVSHERQTNSTPSFKVGAMHPFGIVYGDDAFRDSTVLTNEAMSMFVPWYSDIDLSIVGFNNPNNPFTVGAEMIISHLPPIWAKWYWIVWRKADEISDFSQWVINAAIPIGEAAGTAIVADTNRYIISLDKYYLDNYKGASINHVPAKGDVARFVRKRLNSSSGEPSEYVGNFFELQVMEYLPGGGSDGRSAIVVELFDRTLVDIDTFTGQLIEIYTPRPTIDDDGNLFLPQWRDGSDALEIIDPHTENRAHSGTGIFGYVVVLGNLTSSIVTNLNLSDVEGDPSVQTVVFTNADGDTQTVISTSVLDLGGGDWKINFEPMLIYNFSSVKGGSFTISRNQQVSSGVSVLPAFISINWGDVYVRQRHYATGYDTGSFGIGSNAFWYIEDPHYSDYWLSDIHQFGRINIESNTAKQVHRIASSIHSDTFQADTQINGLSSFSLLNDNIMDMNPVYGEVVRTLVSGREEKTLKCIQERKENSIYIKHYPDVATVPSGDLRVDRETTFSAWYPFKGIYGSVDSGSCILYPDGTTYYYDRQNGCFIHSSESGQVIISERDPNTGNDFKFSKKSREITERLSQGESSFVRSYVDFTQQEVGWCFGYEVLPALTGDVPDAKVGSFTFLFDGNLTSYVGQTIVVDLPTSTVIADIISCNYFSEYDISICVLSEASTENAATGTYYLNPTHEYEIVTFDVMNNRWRSVYDYNFQWFANFGETLVGWGENTQMYLHNQNDSYTFHGESFTQKISVVSNHNPTEIKRYQNITQKSNVCFEVLAYAEPNESYTQMETQMESYLFRPYEGYFKGYYKRNKFSPLFATEEMAMMNGEEIRAHSITHELTYSPTDQMAIFFSLEVTGV